MPVDRRPLFHVLWLLLLVAVGCYGQPQTLEEDVTTANASAQAAVVRHERAEVAPRVQWRSGSIERAPLSLTAGDGSGLRLVSVTGTVVIEDPLALTELRLAFDNPEPRRREGRFEVDLPPGAALSRLAMKIGANWMEGEVVERRRGQRTFESYIHERPNVDPALLEKASANRVSARVFPIEPRQRKEIIVSYSQPLDGGETGTYRLPLQGLPELDALDVQVIVKTVDAATRDRFPTASQRVVHVKERAFVPQKDLVIALDGAQEAAALRAEEYAAVRVRPASLDAADPVDSLVILFDSSASSARGFDDEVDRLADLLEALGETPVRIVAFDQTIEVIHEGAAKAARGEPLATLRERRAFGASDLGAVLASPEARAAGRRVLVWSDGIATAGETDRVALADAAKSLAAPRVDAYVPNAQADRDVLAALVTAGERNGVVLGPDKRGDEIGRTLGQAAFGEVEVAVDGARWFYPRSLRGVAPGNDLVLYAAFEGGAPEEIRIDFSDTSLASQVVPTIEGAKPLLERATAWAHVTDLQAGLERTEDHEEAARLRAQLVRLAVSHRLLTKHTALLVLESEAEYRRFGIDRTALADVLTVGPGGVDLLRRGAGPTGRPLPPVAQQLADNFDPDMQARNAGILGMMQQESGHFLSSPYGGAFAVGNDDEDVWGGLSGAEVGEAFGVGGLGVVGTGRGGGGTAEGTIGLGNTGLIGRGGSGGTGSGYGRGSGAGFGGRGQRVPRVRMKGAKVQGALDRDIVRRIVRAHINEVRFVYNRALQRDPSVQGRVDVQFTIGATGKVVVAVVAGDSTRSPGLARDIAKAVKRWKFPAPRGGGNVVVNFPFVLDPDGSGRVDSRPRWRPRARRASRPRRRRGDPVDGPQWIGSAHTGRFAELKKLVARGQSRDARAEAWEWASTQPDNALALVALGEMLELEERPGLAARVYGSLIDLYPHRADMRRAAAARLEAIGDSARSLAIDSYRKAVELRPDQVNGHRLLAWALAKDGAYEAAFSVLGDAISTPIPSGRFRGVKALLSEDRALVAAAWLASDEDGTAGVDARLRAAGVRPATAPSLRLVADWETDATDVDILVDPIGRGRGRRHADVRTGFGPEAWIARGQQRPKAVTARVRYFDRGAMGYAIGTVSSISHDGEGKLTFKDQPFVLMEAVGSVELGRFAA